MAHHDRAGIDAGAGGQRNASDDTLFELGMMCSIGGSVPTDLVSAHKWFNLAAMQGNKDATRMRVEIAAEMSKTEIAAAQRAARDWLTRH